MALLQQWLWPFLRVGALLLAAPIIGTTIVPARVRMALALIVTGVLVPVLPAPAVIDPFSAQGFSTAIQQLGIGVGIGLVLRIMFTALELAGTIMAQQMGLSFAALVDPQTGASVPVLSQFYIVLMTLFFLAANGHLLMLEALSRSFELLPVATAGISRGGLYVVIDWMGALLAASVLIALPVIVALLVVNVALGVMVRAAPQLNLFAIGFPVMILFGVLVIALTLPGLDDHLARLMNDAFDVITRMLTE
jgi:flagellar biosynthetic protein FliR